MIYIAFSLCLFFLIAALYLFKGKFLNPSVLFFGLWTLILFLSSLNLYDMYMPSDEACWLIILMLFMFFAGNLVGSYKGLKTKKINFSNDLKTKMFDILFILLVIFTLIDVIIVIKNLINGVPMSTIRRWRMGAYGLDSNPLLDRRSFIEETFRSVVLNPFESLLIPVASYNFFFGDTKKKKIKYLLMSLVMLILSSIAGGGGRLSYIYFFGSFFLAFCLYCKDNKNNRVHLNKIRIYKKYLMIFFISGFAITFVFTVIRSGQGSFIKQTYKYFAMAPTLLSVWLPTIKTMDHTYGVLTLFGFHSYFFRAFDKLGLTFLVPQIYNNSYSAILMAEKFKNIGSGVSNAFVTPVFYFYIDGGYFFVILASFVFGFLVEKFYRKFSLNKTMQSFCYYILVMYGIFITFMRIQTAIPSYIISFILVYFLFNRQKGDK